MRVCYFGTYRDNYSRNIIMLEALRCADVDVVECHQTLWHSIDDRVAVASGGWIKLGFIFRLVRTYWQLLFKFRQIREYDVMVVGYPGQIDVFLAWILSRIRRKPLVLDVFMSLYLIACERGLVEKHPFTGRLLHLIEKAAYRLPDMLIQDTDAYVQWLISEFGVNADRFRLVPTGADDRLFHPVKLSDKNDDTFTVLYYGSFIPNHGVIHIITAAEILVDSHDIMFVLVGDGPDKATVKYYAEKHSLKNVKFVPWLSQEELLSYIARSHICLGAFGDTPQSLMTVQNKIYECMAMGKPVVTGDSHSLRKVFDHLDHVYLVKRTSGLAIANAIRHLYADSELREYIAKNGCILFKEQYSLFKQGQRLLKHLQALLLSR